MICDANNSKKWHIFYCYGLCSSQDTHFYVFQDGVGGHFEKWAIKELSRHFWEVYGGHFFLK